MFDTYEIEALRAWVLIKTAQIRDGRDERGEIAQTVLIVSILAGAAIVIATIIATKFTDKANTIPSGG